LLLLAYDVKLGSVMAFHLAEMFCWTLSMSLPCSVKITDIGRIA